MGNEETYTMEFTCSNCGYIFESNINRGAIAKGSGGECKICGIVDNGSFKLAKPLRIRNAEAMQNINYFKSEMVREGNV